MITIEEWVMIKHMHKQGVPKARIVRELGLDPHINSPPKCLTSKPAIQSILDPYKEYVNQRLGKYDLTATRILREIKERGYPGSYTILRNYVRQVKGAKLQPAFVRFETEPGEQAQMDWSDFGWVAKEYGLEACLAKIDYMKEHRKQHSITNPKGFFRTALVRDFQPPAFIVAKIKADEVAKREKERCRRKREEWRQITTNCNYGSATASLQKLLDSLN